MKQSYRMPAWHQWIFCDGHADVLGRFCAEDMKRQKGGFSSGLTTRVGIGTLADMKKKELHKKDHGMPIALRAKGTAKELIVDGKPFIMLGGEVHNSSASSLKYMEAVWDKFVALHCNTAIVPLYWELIEPVEGEFDFTLVDGLIAGARAHNLRLVFLWFGTWKNAESTYVPAWVKTHTRRFLRARNKDGHTMRHISALCREACEADCRAFAQTMRHIRKVDGRKHTVLMMQVENETGLLGSSRDFSPLAEESFGGAVPLQLMDYLTANKDALMSELRQIWKAAGDRKTGTWSEVFGAGADEVFMAWHIGKYVNAVTAAGKAEYALPMFVNCWLVQHDQEKPGEYPSGGPVSRMFDVWRAAAPRVDVFAVDIYLPDFRKVCDMYAVSGNPLLIPEARRSHEAAGNAYYALAHRDALCFAPFGLESMDDSHPLGLTNALLAELMPVMIPYRGTGKMIGVYQGANDCEVVELGGFRLTIRFSQKERVGDQLNPGGLIISTAPGEYIVAGFGFTVDFGSLSKAEPCTDFIFIEEGVFRGGRWVPGRRLNGDEYYCVRMGSAPGAVKAKVYQYA